MMDGMNDNWGIEHDYGLVIGLIVIVAIIWLVIKLVNKNHTFH